MRIFICCLLTLLALPAAAQLTETFADGNFTQNPAWTGDAAGFEVNAQLQLQTNGPATTGTVLQLATASTAANGATWEFYANLKLATSSGNYADVWLLSEQADLKGAGNRGYFVRLGGTPDEVSLFRKDATGSPVYVVNGRDQSLSSTTNNLAHVRVTRSLADGWTLEVDYTGTGQSYQLEGIGEDNTYLQSSYLGVIVTYSSSNNRSFLFDDFKVTDQQAPGLVLATPTAARQLNVVFDEAVSETQAVGSYQLSGGPAIISATRDAQNQNVVHLTLAADLPTGANTLVIRSVADVFGNVLTGPFNLGFTNSGFAISPGVNQLLITEILADETPVIGLPASEYLEIYNPTTNILNLGGVRLLKPGSSGNPAVFPATATLLPGEYAVVCGSTRVELFAGVNKVFGVSNFPSLSNGGDQLVLRAPAGQTLYEIRYSDTWYKDAEKKEGGWSLEMIDPANPCGGIENWTASADPSGGTPGRANAVRTANADSRPPALQRALALSATLVRLYFSEKLDSVAASSSALYTIAGNTITRVAAVSPDFRVVDLTLGTALQPSQPVTVSVQRATDCVGNATGAAATATVALPSVAVSGDVVVNEILFNPRTGGYDFVELLNRSAKYINLQGWQIGNEKPDGSVDAASISSEAYVLAPGQLVALTERPDVVQAQYPTSSEPAAFLELADLPTFPDDAGIVTLYDRTGAPLERVPYSAKQHLALLDDVNGVSLERIRAAGGNEASNFHSAAGSVGYATPGRRNSQLQEDPTGTKLFSLEPEVFTPDADGQQDFTTLNYTLDQTGYAASVTIYDAQGRPVRKLVRNQTLATSGFVQWDGLTDQGRKAGVGVYVLHIELFRPSGGDKREYKRTVVVGARF
ncbi:lamin tail domain-containing protein [Hymenobacter sp. J193]|uniref:lamin tail domain-containing protein n=1 Tax=Hymenobacter sp. J193 TaxID=2898429 RepID=UPI002150E98B|nr:lamin tail domain-containing protein [Hymenobacter sp. J193]MCR5888540.1 lamin tail domain-containing protein [Hymenobacter sp. J193]